MCQVLFWIPLSRLDEFFWDIPIYGYGTMLFLAFVLCTWLACKLGERDGFAKERIQDLAIWVFIIGILGARITYMVQYRQQYSSPLLQFFAIWDGGLVFYGSFIGGALGYFAAYFLFLRKYHIGGWKMVDIIAPCVALGLMLGRIGCLLNGCCYGNVACHDCAGIQFPLPSPPRFAFVERGLQTAAGFTMAGSTTIGAVEPQSPAARAGLRAGDQIRTINGKEIKDGEDLHRWLVKFWERGKNDLEMTVEHADGREESLPAFYPKTLRLHPTQVYESISMALLLFLLLAYYPLKKYDGTVFILFMVTYAAHRFLNEMLRTDTDPVAFSMTLSQNLSVLMVIAAAGIGVVVWWREARRTPPAPALS